MRVSKHISYNEGVRSNTATRKGINNIPTNEEFKSMQLVAEKVFEPLREHFNLPIRINSFFRCSALNVAVGGSGSSQHCKGEAIDMKVVSKYVSNADLFNYIKANLEFDQLIWEYGTDDEPQWIHVSFKANDNNRGIILKAVKGKGYIRL